MLKNRVGIVTGGIEGIGRSISSLLLKEGAVVVATYYSNDKAAEKMKQDFTKYKDNLMIVKCDNRDEKKVKSLLKQIKQQFGKMDYLINNAGISSSKYLVNMDLDQWNKVMDVNLTGAFLTTKYSLPLLLKSKNSSIVNLSSQVGITGNKGQSNYATTKAGIIGFTYSLAQEYSKKNIRVNAVAPGFIDTNITNEMSNLDILDKKNNVLLERLGTTEEVANVVIFLVSSLSSYINSTVIQVDGGRRF